MDYLLPAIRLLPTDSLPVRKLDSASFDRGQTTPGTAGNLFGNPGKTEVRNHDLKISVMWVDLHNILSSIFRNNSFKIHSVIANCPIQPEPAMYPSQLWTRGVLSSWARLRLAFQFIDPLYSWCFQAWPVLAFRWLTFKEKRVFQSVVSMHLKPGWWPSVTIVGTCRKTTDQEKRSRLQFQPV